MSNLDEMKHRLEYIGGETSDGRIVRGKYLSFKSSLENSYQAEWIEFNDKTYRCLINPVKLSTDYDQKEISIDFESKMKNGDTFYWPRTKYHWQVSMQDFSEEAYFRAKIQRCDYDIDINENKYWVYLKGPAETSLVWNQKHDIEFNDMNYSLLMYITKNDETLDYFSRFQVVKFQGHNWRVCATDKYSQDGLIEVYLEEYFDNEMQDAMVEPEEATPDTTKPYIDGPQFVKPYDTNLTYTIVNTSNGAFVVNSNKVKITSSDETSCVIEIITGKSNKFTLSYQDGDTTIAALDVTIQSL